MKPEKVIKSRYVLTEKPIEPEDVAKVTQEGLLLPDQADGPCKAKARHVMKGFSETKHAMAHWALRHPGLPLWQQDSEGTICRSPKYHPKGRHVTVSPMDRTLRTNTYPGFHWNLGTRRAGLIPACSSYEAKVARK